MGRIFISYRREDSAPQAGRLADHLSQKFGRSNVFLDVDAIAPGDSFPAMIDRALETTDVALVLIGRTWYEGRSWTGVEPDEQDWVRTEVAAALRREDVRVIPVLLEGATMPKVDALPDDLRPLVTRNAFQLTSVRWSTEVAELTSVIEAHRRAARKSRPTRARAGALVLLAFLVAALATAFVRAGGHSQSAGRPQTSWHGQETTGGLTHTWSNYKIAGGTEGPLIPPFKTVEISCKAKGFKVADGNRYWYLIASSPWRNGFYASADAFYNRHGLTSGSLSATQFVDPAIPDC